MVYKDKKAARKYAREYYHKNKITRNIELVRRKDGTFNNPSKIDIPVEIVVTRYNNGEPTTTIAKDYNVDKTIIRRILLANNIKLRSVKEISQTKIGIGSSRFSGYKQISGYCWANIKQSAKHRNIQFDITIEYAWSLVEKQNHICALSGLPICFAKTTKEKQYGLQTASLDRIDSSKGYIKGNVQWVHKDINRMKNKYSTAYFLDLCKKVTVYNQL